VNAVNARRPAIYLAVAAVVSLFALLLPEPVPATVPRPTTPTAEPPPPPSAAPACTEVRGSLRPAGPPPPPGSMPPDSTMALIAGRGRLIAGVDQGNYRLGYRDSLSGELAGADIDLAHRIAEAIFGDPNRVQFIVLDIAERATAIQDGQVDVVVNSFTVTCARQRVVEFSSPYLAVSQRMLVPVGSGVREVEDLAGKRVCTSRGSTTEDVLRGLPLDLDVITFPRLPSCMLELQRGRVAAVSSDDVILAGLAAQDPQTEVVGRPLSNDVYAVGISPVSPDLVRFVNGVLEQGRVDGSLAASYRSWFGDYVNPVPRPPPARYRD
jgi:polar amino acid transport system substrate-binding protein